ncbi:hypothetical protein DUI87_33562 [Hirundo rustica rustica]|uniref:Uncharacterized protein n=1 Tax=Hirundo rustica rustica TaxID=333673 RepID=A0A3M0IKZ0_HIRRU|nr:hypothetical protein DUI87_33562 [Hirundo rustica rustica]
MLTLRRSSSLPVPGCSCLASCPGGPKGERPSRLQFLFRRGQIPWMSLQKCYGEKKSRARRLAPFCAFIRKPSSGGELEELRMLPAYSLGNAEEEKEIHDLKVQLTSTAEKEQDYLNQLLTLKTDLEQKANELESLKEKMAKTSEEIKSKLDEREENVNKLQLEIENMNKQHKEAVDIYQKDIESRKVNENKLHEEVEKMKLLYDEATMIQRETDIRCQHKITEMVALMEKHKNEYDKMVEEKDAELKIYKIRQQKQLSSERALEAEERESEPGRNRGISSFGPRKDIGPEPIGSGVASASHDRVTKYYRSENDMSDALEGTSTMYAKEGNNNHARGALPLARKRHGKTVSFGQCGFNGLVHQSQSCVEVAGKVEKGQLAA